MGGKKVNRQVSYNEPSAMGRNEGTQVHAAFEME